MRTPIRALALLVAVVLSTTLLAACSDVGYVVTTTFDDVGDLQSRHSVQMADVRIGTIRSVRLTDDFRAEVRMTIDGGRRVPRDSVAVLRTTSLLGEKFVELRPNGDPGAGPYLRDGDVLDRSLEAPELEFVAEEAIAVLGAVVSTDVASLIETGAEAFGGRGEELGALIQDLAAISASLASRTDELQRIIDGLDATTAQLAAGGGDLATLLTNSRSSSTGWRASSRRRRP